MRSRIVTEPLTVVWDGRRLRMRSVEVGLGLTNELAATACGHRHKLGDTVWMSRWPGRVILCDDCAQTNREKRGDNRGPHLPK